MKMVLVGRVTLLRAPLHKNEVTMSVCAKCGNDTTGTRFCASCGLVVRASNSVPEGSASASPAAPPNPQQTYQQPGPQQGYQQAGYVQPGYAQTGYPQPYYPQSSGKKTSAGICGILLGALGIHKFVLGYTAEGVIMLVLGLLTCGVVTSVIGLIEGIIYLTKSDAEFDAIYVHNKRGWF